MKDFKYNANKENLGINAYGLVWSGSFMPMIGETVKTPNHGFCVVTGYFTEHGYLGVECKQDNASETLHFFGIEISKG
mgnify:CR=1 FL=1